MFAKLYMSQFVTYPESLLWHSKTRIYWVCDIFYQGEQTVLVAGTLLSLYKNGGHSWMDGSLLPLHLHVFVSPQLVSMPTGMIQHWSRQGLWKSVIFVNILFKDLLRPSLKNYLSDFYQPNILVVEGR